MGSGDSRRDRQSAGKRSLRVGRPLPHYMTIRIQTAMAFLRSTFHRPQTVSVSTGTNMKTSILLRAIAAANRSTCSPACRRCRGGSGASGNRIKNHFDGVINAATSDITTASVRFPKSVRFREAILSFEDGKQGVSRDRNSRPPKWTHEAPDASFLLTG